MSVRMIQSDGTEKVVATNISSESTQSTVSVTDVAISGNSVTVSKSDGTQATQNVTYSNATNSAAGLMSAADKSKLDGLSSGSSIYTKDVYNISTTLDNYGSTTLAFTMPTQSGYTFIGCYISQVTSTTTQIASVSLSYGKINNTNNQVLINVSTPGAGGTVTGKVRAVFYK